MKKTLHPTTRLKACTMALVAMLTVTGCAVGPDFRRPDAPQGDTIAAEPLPDRTEHAAVAGGQPQYFAYGAAVSSEWWKAFASPQLDEMVAQALRASPELAAARAALRAARETAAAQRGSFWPSVDVGYAPVREKAAEADSAPYTLHQGELRISYTPDVFGANLRQAEAHNAQVQQQCFEREAVYATLVANVVNAAIEEASLRAQVAATEELVNLSSRLLDISRKQQALGELGGAEVTAQEVALAQVQITLPPLRKELASQRNQMALLLGRLPSHPVEQTFELSALKLPMELPVSLPSTLVEQRPDIRAAEAQLHAASAEIGIAKAARFPSLTLTATAGRFGTGASDLTRSGGGFWSFGLDLLQPVFRGGELMHQQRAAEALYEQAAHQYRAAVLTAFHDTANTLQAIVSDSQTLRIASVSEDAARRSLWMSTRQRELGAASLADLLLAQQNYQEAALTLITSQAARFTNTVALYQALGGWWSPGADGVDRSRSECEALGAIAKNGQNDQ